MNSENKPVSSPLQSYKLSFTATWIHRLWIPPGVGIGMDEAFMWNVNFSYEAHFICTVLAKVELSDIGQRESSLNSLIVDAFPTSNCIVCFLSEREECAPLSWKYWRNIVSEFLAWIGRDGPSSGSSKMASRETHALLQEKNLGLIISSRGDLNWPERSCDLTPFFFGVTQSHIFTRKFRE